MCDRGVLFSNKRVLCFIYTNSNTFFWPIIWLFPVYGNGQMFTQSLLWHGRGQKFNSSIAHHIGNKKDGQKPVFFCWAMAEQLLSDSWAVVKAGGDCIRQGISVLRTLGNLLASHRGESNLKALIYVASESFQTGSCWTGVRISASPPTTQIDPKGRGGSKSPSSPDAS